MGVCIWKCDDKNQENIIKDSNIDCYKKTDQSIFANVITSNNITEDKKLSNMKSPIFPNGFLLNHCSKLILLLNLK